MVIFSKRSSFKVTLIIVIIFFSNFCIATDADRDSLPDDWEIANGYNPIIPDYQIAAGEQICGLDDTGVVCWGSISNPGSHHNVPNLINPTHINGSCAIDDTGVVCWGSMHAYEVPALNNPTAISNKGDHACVLDDSEIKCWGDYNAVTPQLNNPTEVSVGGFTVCAIDDLGVNCWSDQFENIDFTPPNLMSPSDISVSTTHACAIDNSEVICWGDGDGYYNIPDFQNPIEVHVDYKLTCVIDDNGVSCWGMSGGFNQHFKYVNDQKPVRLISKWWPTGIVVCVLSDYGITCIGDNERGNTDIPLLVIDPDQDGFTNQGGVDVFPFDSSEWVDNDVDGIGDNLDLDDDNDGISDLSEIELGINPLITDSDFDTLPDSFEVENSKNPLVRDYIISGACAIDDNGVKCWGDYWESASGIITPPKLDNPGRLSANNELACVIDNGEVICRTIFFSRDYWGNYPVPELSNPTYIHVSQGLSAACALDDSGISCWGPQVEVLLNNIPEVTNPIQISTNGDYACVLDDSEIKCWGDNKYGTLNVPELSNPIQISSGYYHSCALDESGVVCWGNNDFDKASVPDLKNPSQVGVGMFHSCALDDTGVVCWGRSWQGVTNVPDLSNPVSIFVNSGSTCAIDDTGLVCWGSIDTTSTGNKFNFSDLIHPVEVSAQCAIDNSKLVCWGSEWSQDRDGLTPPDVIEPIDMSAESNHACLIDQGKVSCWGDNFYDKLNPPDLINPRRVVVKDDLACAIDDIGIHCWGDTGFHIPTFVRSSPDNQQQTVSNPSEISIGRSTMCSIHKYGVKCFGNLWGIKDIPVFINPRQLISQITHACAIDKPGIVLHDSKVICWGDDDYGGTSVPEFRQIELRNPYLLSSGGTVDSVSKSNTCAVDDTGLVCWGGGSPQITPPNLVDAAQISGRCALLPSGVLCWGPNENGETNVPDLFIDPDGDGYSTHGNLDAFPLDASEWIDSDLDGIGDNADLDDDNDGVADSSDAYPLNDLYSKDTDSDGMPDSWEILYGLDPNDPSDASSDRDNDGYTALEEFINGTIPYGSIDIDGNERYDALTDGLLILRSMFGLDGSSLIAGTAASDAVYSDSGDLLSRINTLGDLADIDGSGDIDALTDGLLILRHLFGLEGETLVAGVVSNDATRTTEEIEAHLNMLMP